MMLFPLKSMSSSIKCITKIFILIVYLLTILFILYYHYVEVGECIHRVYYYPLDRRDYILITTLGIIMLSLSLCLLHCPQKLGAIEMFICKHYHRNFNVGNEILASRTIDYPETYKVEKLKL